MKERHKRNSWEENSAEGAGSSLDQAEDTARYYGFRVFPFPSLTKEIKNLAVSLLKEDGGEESPCAPLLSSEEKIAVLKFVEEKSLPKDQVLMLAFSSRLAKQAKERKLLLEVMGTTKNIAEAVVIHTVVEILREEGLGEGLSLKINSLGDKDTATRFHRELQAFWKKNLNELTPSCKDGVRRDPIRPLCCGHEKCQKIAGGVPKPIAFLSEGQRSHFMGVLEYLETLDIPYEIDDSLIGSKSWACQVIFSACDKDGKTLASGIRYNQLARKIGGKRDIPAFGAKIILPATQNGKLINRKNESPKICFVQLGADAKHKSLNVLRILRKSRMPVYQALSKDRIGAQLAAADNLKIPYVIIMGQKEAVTNSVIIRNNENKSQETVSLEELPTFLKSIKDRFSHSKGATKRPK